MPKVAPINNTIAIRLRNSITPNNTINNGTVIGNVAITHAT
nr:MAG TPA: hypothetical protein [Caudoviricetes sp.]